MNDALFQNGSGTLTKSVCIDAPHTHTHTTHSIHRCKKPTELYEKERYESEFAPRLRAYLTETETFLRSATKGLDTASQENAVAIVLTCATYSLRGVQWADESKALSATELLNAAALLSGFPVHVFVMNTLPQVLSAIEGSLHPLLQDMAESKSLALSIYTSRGETQPRDGECTEANTGTAHTLQERVDQLCFAWLVTTFVQGRDLSRTDFCIRRPSNTEKPSLDTVTVAQFAPALACRLVLRNTQDTALRRMGALLLRHCARTLTSVELNWCLPELERTLVHSFNLRDDADVLHTLMEAALAVGRTTKNAELQDMLVSEWVKHTGFVSSSAASTGADTLAVEQAYFRAGLGFVKLAGDRAAMNLRELVRTATSQYATFAVGAKEGQIRLAHDMLDLLNYLMERFPMLMRCYRIRVLKALCTTFTCCFADTKRGAHVATEDVLATAQTLASCCTEEQRKELAGVLDGFPELEPLLAAVQKPLTVD